jgi:K+-transporting ATPase KdpF subunit
MPSPAIAFEESLMTIDYALGAIVTLGLFVYLIYALIRPERF